MESPPRFNSVEDECRYWKERAKFYHKEWTDVKQEFDEYVEQSRQVEAEMDATLDQKQSAIKDLRMKITNLEKENESFRLRLDSHVNEYTNIEKQLESVRTERDSMKDYLRQLEQKNDDLERAHRILNESIADFEAMLDKAYEKNALLEMEVDEKEVLQEKLQRLMDETRDLKQELNVKARYPPSTTLNATLSSPLPNGVVENNKSYLSSSDQLHVGHNQSQISPTAGTTMYNDYSPHSLKNPDNLLNGNAMNASSRTTALNIVADMLRKLNLDKALLCPRCEKFRCICDRPLPSGESNCDEIVSSIKNNTEEKCCTSINSNNNINGDSYHITMASTNNCNNSFGSNIFKRFAQRFSSPSSIPIAAYHTDDEKIDVDYQKTQNAMESKLKTYREQTPAIPPRQ